MTHSFPTRRSSDLVVAEALPDHLLDEEGLFIGAAARRNAADRACAILRLDTAKLARGVSDGFVPAHLAPRLADRGPAHRFPYAVLMLDRTSVGSGKSGSVRVDLGGRRSIKQKNNTTFDTSK